MNWLELLAPIMNRRADHRQAWRGLIDMLTSCEPDHIASFVQRLQRATDLGRLSDNDQQMIKRLATTAIMEGLIRIGEQVETEAN